jgi:hypothetical protein
METIGCPEMAVNFNQLYVKSQKNEDLFYKKAEA